MNIDINDRNDSYNKNIYLIICIIVVALLVVGGTYAYMILTVNAINDSYATETTCFDIDYDVTNDDGTLPISGDMFPSSSAKGGLSGKVSLKINDNCSVEGVGTIMLNVVNASNTFIQTVAEHCENSVTLSTMTDFTTSSDCTAKTNGIWVTNGSALKYAVYDTNDVTTDTIPLSVGYVSKTGSINIYDNIDLSKIAVSYYVYIWLDGNLSDNSYAGLSFVGNISASATQIEEYYIYKDTLLNDADPVLDSGMVPIVLSNTGVATVADTSQEWYNYGDKEWANAVLVKENATSGVDGSYSRKYYLNNPGTTVAETDILAYYVWIPRYKYRIWTTDASTTTSPQPINIVFEGKDTTKSNGTSVGQYLTHPAFTFGDEELNGIWVGKFETSGDATTPTIKPNLQSLRKQTISERFTTSLKFSGGTMNTSNGVVTFAGSSTYGLTAEVDSHMMKNSEWGAVVYLSHSQYGINQEIYINNSSGYYTGRSGGNAGGSQNTLSTQFGSESTSNRYNLYGYYTWTGQAISSDGIIGIISDSTLGTKASTTGNVTGIFDMSGGSWEYVMGVLSDSNGNPRSQYSGFNGSRYNGNTDELITDGIVFPNNKYYDLYLQSQFSGDFSTDIQFCTLETCGGQALNETAGWYSDSAYFVELMYPWFLRSGDYATGLGAGAFDSSRGYGGNADNYSWRSVLVFGD